MVVLVHRCTVLADVARADGESHITVQSMSSQKSESNRLRGACCSPPYRASRVHSRPGAGVVYNDITVALIDCGSGCER